MDCTEKPTHGKLDNQMATILSKDWRMDDRLLEVSGHWIVCQERKRSKRVDGISTVLRFPLSLPQLTNHIPCHYWTLTQLTHRKI